MRTSSADGTLASGTDAAGEVVDLTARRPVEQLLRVAQ